ncbi:MAG: efflux RND transporter periplasmic adaptor subunit [Ignavibacteriae bacterium]|nr:efflux RND transporter periplasmic adaptor subunit [Ignavibacteriota bacterium]
MILRIKLFSVIMLFFIYGCKSNENYDHSNLRDEQEHNDTHNESETETISLSESELKEFGIEIKEANSGIIQRHIDVTGEIRIDPSKISHIVPRYSGIVQNVYKSVGDYVNKGELLAEIESNESLAKYEVHSLINGTIIEMHMTQGELIGNAEHAFTVANLESVWAMFNIYQKDLSVIKVGQSVSISLGTDGIFENGRISYVSPIVDETTRTAVARVIVNNNKGTWRPGMFITGKVIIGNVQVKLAVEKAAVQNMNGTDVIFIKRANEFTPTVVELGIQNDTSVEIINGLENGQHYVSKGAFILKAELMKEEFGGGHAH